MDQSLQKYGPTRMATTYRRTAAALPKLGKRITGTEKNAGKGSTTNKRYVSCYASKDLINWKFKGDVLQLTDPENLGRRWVCERPKVFYNKKTKKYVMYLHLDNSTYKLARVAVCTSDKPDGNFTYVKSFRPLDHESRDIGQFVDDDGTPYLIFEDRPFGFRIATLTEDYLGVDKEVCLIPYAHGGRCRC
jgi:hypothetical protein